VKKLSDLGYLPPAFKILNAPPTNSVQARRAPCFLGAPMTRYNYFRPVATILATIRPIYSEWNGSDRTIK